MKKHIRIVLSLFVFLLSVTVSHGSVSPVSVEEQMAFLKAYVACSDTPDYIKKWETTPASLGLGIRTVTSFASGETAYTSVIVRGYTIGEKGDISLEAGFEFIKPDGKILFAEKNYAKYNATGQKEIAFVMLNPSMNISFDNTDLEGDYVLRFHVTDNLAGKKTVASAKITLRGKVPGAEAPTTPAVMVKKVAEGSLLAEKEVAAVEKATSPVKVTETSKEPTPAVKATMVGEETPLAEKEIVAVEKTAILVKVAEIIEEPIPVETVIEAGKKITPLKENSGESILQAKITDAEVLDNLWDYYYTSKDERAVQRIISILHWIGDGHGLEKAFGGAARSSLTRNAAKNKAVYSICKNYLQKADQKNQKYLEEIVAKVDAGK